jgi:hypothetical protein
VRIEGWETLLARHIADPPPFEWGQNDCALWCADWLNKATGQDFSSHWRGTYTTENELLLLMTEQGFWSPRDIADHHLERVSVPLAQRGDIVLHPHCALGICDGTFSYFLTEAGITRLGTLRCPCAWKVG